MPTCAGETNHKTWGTVRTSAKAAEAHKHAAALRIDVGFSIAASMDMCDSFCALTFLISRGPLLARRLH
jgi:hypothetical protein